MSARALLLATDHNPLLQLAGGAVEDENFVLARHHGKPVVALGEGLCGGAVGQGDAFRQGEGVCIQADDKGRNQD